MIETEHDGKRAFLIVIQQTMPKDSKVLKLSTKVLKPIEDLDTESRLSALESEIGELKSALF